MSVLPTPFRNILIANRGEIACRIIRTARTLGLRTIAVYSEADTNAPHVRMADDAFLLGPSPVGQSYLAIDRIIEAIRQTGAQSVHPGYGFLSENAAFAKACADAGAVFIGPNIEAIDIMGDKAKSKRRMIKAGVPCIPGYQGDDQSDDTLITQAKDIGYPLMVKAAAGGGGRGMRLVHRAEDLASSITLARGEAQNAFGSGDLILERAIIEPRHVEIQVFADKHGNVIHLGERDCSVQRRHQKVLEESPCPAMTPDLRAKMGAAAVDAARDVNYVGAGTVEFLLDGDGKFYFLEMNTRLQVEHPVTEIVTGLDLVAMQIRVARGEPLGIAQSDVTLDGHAIEARLYAEDPSNDFLPATGLIDYWCPAIGDAIRIDAGIQTGGEVSPFYDPMLAKVIAYGATRYEARCNLVEALKDTALFGVATNKQFLIDALEQPEFASGDATTGFIERCFSQEALKRAALTFQEAAVAALLLFIHARDRAHQRSIGVPNALLNWSSATLISTPFRFGINEQEFKVEITPVGANDYRVCGAGAELLVEVTTISDHCAMMTLNGIRTKVRFNIPAHDPALQTVQFSIDGRDRELTNLNGFIKSSVENVGAGSIIAPMHGLLLDVFVQVGDQVSRGDRLGILEAMKMQHELCALIDGTVHAVHFEAGAQVAARSVLIEITIDQK